MDYQRLATKIKVTNFVVRDPERLAVALQYTLGCNMTPVVTAKGADSLAEQIAEEAERLKWEITDDPALAQSLYETVGLNEKIPKQFYKDIVQIVYLIYKKNNELHLLEKIPR